jgi:hypothetical protein
VTPLLALAVIPVVSLVAFAVITGIHAVTVWPLVLLIAKVFDGREEPRPGAPGSAETSASEDRRRTGPEER